MASARSPTRSTAARLPHHEDGTIPQLDEAADASVTHLDYPEPDALVRHLRSISTSTLARKRTCTRAMGPSVYWYARAFLVDA